MKIAICITGQARHHWHQIWTECNFLNINNSNLQVDFFVHTWSTVYSDSGYTDNNTRLLRINDLDKLEKDIKRIFKPVELMIEDVDALKAASFNMDPQIYSFFRTLEMIHKSKIEYDFILKARFDVFIAPRTPKCYIERKKSKNKQLYEKAFYDYLNYFYSKPYKNILCLESLFINNPFRLHMMDKIFLIKGNWIFNSWKYNFFELYETEIHPMQDFPIIEKSDINSAHSEWVILFKVMADYADIKIYEGSCEQFWLRPNIIRKGYYNPNDSFKQLHMYNSEPYAVGPYKIDETYLENINK